MIGLPPRLIAAPRMKSICPPIPEWIAWPIESAHTCPVRSICSAELIAVVRSFLRMASVSLVRSQGWNSTSGLSLTNSNSRGEPATKLVTIRPGWIVLSRLVITPPSTSGTTLSENISVWMPRSCLFPSRLSTASGIAPIPSWRQAPSSTRFATCSPMAEVTADGGWAGRVGSGRSVVQKAVTLASGTAEWPWVRGIAALISASTIPAVSTAALAASIDVPSVQKPWRSGGESCTIAASSRTWPLVKRLGMSERKTGTKSASPSLTIERRLGPVKSETDRRCAA